jgi:hypothetical protein
VPDLVEVVFFFFREALYPELFEQLFEGIAVEGVEIRPSPFAAPDPVH